MRGCWNGLRRRRVGVPRYVRVLEIGVFEISVEVMSYTDNLS
jgi:hypothetical protein